MRDFSNVPKINRAPGRQKGIYIKSRDATAWGDFEAFCDASGISQSDALAEAVTLWVDTKLAALQEKS